MKYIKEFKLFEAWTQYEENGETIYSTRGQEGTPVPGGARYFDPYEYCIRDNQWFARKRPSRDNSRNIPWFQINKANLTDAQICQSITILDTQFPDARSKAAQQDDYNKFCNKTTQIQPAPDTSGSGKTQVPEIPDNTGSGGSGESETPPTVTDGDYYHDDVEMVNFTKFCVTITSILEFSDKYREGQPLISDCKSSWYKSDAGQTAVKRINNFFLGKDYWNPKENSLDFSNLKVQDDLTPYPYDTPDQERFVRDLEPQSAHPKIKKWYKSIFGDRATTKEKIKGFYPNFLSEIEDYWNLFIYGYKALLKKIKSKDNTYKLYLPPYYSLWAKQYYSEKPQTLEILNKFLIVKVGNTKVDFKSPNFVEDLIKAMRIKIDANGSVKFDPPVDVWIFSPDTGNSPDF